MKQDQPVKAGLLILKEVTMQEGEYVYSYSRAQAIQDGVLLDVSDEATKIGIRYPVAVTESLYHYYIKPSEMLEEGGQTTTGRLMDVLMLLVFATKRLSENISELHFKVSFLMAPEKREIVGVWAAIDGGDDGNPVITIMLEGED